MDNDFEITTRLYRALGKYKARIEIYNENVENHKNSPSVYEMPIIKTYSNDDILNLLKEIIG